jgi:uncharacterized membrane protein
MEVCTALQLNGVHITILYTSMFTASIEEGKKRRNQAIGFKVNAVDHNNIIYLIILHSFGAVCPSKGIS